MPHLFGSVVLAGTLLGSGAFAASIDIEIKPGPTTMSAAERALEPDPAAGTEHAEILVMEFERDEDYRLNALYHVHYRIKIHSAEARDWADVEIPHRTNYDQLQRWWGRTILLDGTVLELTEDQLERQRSARVGSTGETVAKAALPGVVPGCVIDYGFTLKLDRAYMPYQEIRLQREAPIHSFRYRWKPTRELGAAYRVTPGVGFELDARRDKDSVLVTAKDVPALVYEPMMPPPDSISASVVFYYYDGSGGLKDYWTLKAKRRAGSERPPEVVRRAVTEIGLDPASPLDDRLRSAYAWLLRRIKNTNRLTMAEVESRALDEDTPDGTNALARGEGSAGEIDRLFADVARALGAEAHLVLATNRTRRLWDQSLLSMNQFSEMVVAVRDRDAAKPEYTFVDPGSGLPYGELPWWVTGASAMMATKDGAKEIFLPPGPASQNVRETRVAVRLGELGEPITASWTVRAKGQIGTDDRTRLHRSAPDERQRLLDTLCGAQSGIEVLRAESPESETSQGEMRVDCEIEFEQRMPEDKLGRFRWDARGVWIDSIPDLRPGKRHHPVVFDYPYVDLMTLDCTAPSGMHPGAVPEPIQLDSPFGRYQRRVSIVDGGFRVERKLAIIVLAVPPSDYDALRGFHDAIARADAEPLDFLGDE